MFPGTSLVFQLAFYVTSMSPAILLFITKILYLSYGDNQVEHSTITSILLFVVLFLLGLSFGLRTLLKYQYQRGTYEEVNEDVHDSLTNDNIEVVNGDSISFLISNITSVFLVQDYILPSVIMFFIFQFLMFVIGMRSNRILPNVLLMIFGVDICVTKNNNFLVVFKEDMKNNHKIVCVGDNNRSKTCITNNLNLINQI